MDDRLKIKILSELESVCLQIQNLLVSQRCYSFGPHLESCIEIIRKLQCNWEEDLSKEVISKLSALSDGHNSLSDFRFSDIEKTKELYKVVHMLSAKINEYETASGLSREIGEYDMSKDGKIKYRWYNKGKDGKQR